MADRRDVPHVVVALHLRPGLPGRAHRAGARARRRAAARTARTSPTRRSRRRSRSSPKKLGDDEWQFKTVGMKKRRVEEGRQGRVADAPASTDACVFLNRPGFEAGPGCALHLHAIEHGQALQRDQAHGLLAAPAAHLRPRRGRRRLGHVDAHRVRPRRLGRGRRGVRAGGARRRQEAFTAHEPVYKSMEPELRLDARRRRVRRGREVLRRAPRGRAAAVAASGARCRCSLGRTRIRRP